MYAYGHENVSDSAGGRGYAYLRTFPDSAGGIGYTYYRRPDSAGGRGYTYLRTLSGLCGRKRVYVFTDVVRTLREEEGMLIYGRSPDSAGN